MTQTQAQAEAQKVVDEMMNNLTLKSASFFFRNDEPFGFGVTYHADNPEITQYIQGITSFGETTMSKLRSVDNSEEKMSVETMSVDELIEQTEKMCIMIKSCKVDKETKLQYMFYISANIYCLELINHPLIKTNFTGCVFNHVSK